MAEITDIGGINYKINEKGTYKISCRDWNGKKFYNIALQQKKYDGTSELFNRSVSFFGCEPPQNGDFIKIKTGFESNYKSKKDPYAWITTIVIQDYEVVDPPEQTAHAAYEEYNKKAQENAEDIVITSEDLPF